MKKMLAIAMAFAAVASSAFAQQTEQINPRGFVLNPPTGPRPTIENGVLMPSVDTTFIWQSYIIRRGDTVRMDPVVPRAFGKNDPSEPTTIFRGIGQIFAPYALYPTYYPSVYNSTSDILGNDDPNTDVVENDSDYIAQFKDATSFQIDTVYFFLYKNLTAGSVTSTSGKLLAWRLSSAVNLTSTSYKSNGLSLSRQDPKLQGFPEYDNQPYEEEITPDVIEAATEEDLNNPGSYTIHPTVFTFDPPLMAGNKEAIILMYANDDAVPFDQNSQPTDEFQQVIGYLEYKKGTTNDSNDVANTPLDATNAGKSFGVVLYSTDNGSTVKDTVFSTFNHLFYTLKRGTNPPATSTVVPARMNMNMVFIGRVTLASGVQYYYGKDATSQGFGAVTPNPVRESAVIPFSLTERSNVKIDLYNAAGEHVKNLLEARYIPGNYSIDLPTTGLQSGTYLVRMTAGEKAYSTKINVVK